jgi:hypothetical protein
MHLPGKNKHRLKMKGCKKIFQANRTVKQGGVALLTSDKTIFNPKFEEISQVTYY